MEKFLTREEAAERLDISLRTLDRRCEQGLLGKYYFSSRVKLSQKEIDAYIAGSRVVRTEAKRTRKKSKSRAPARTAWKPGEKLV